MRTLLGGVVQNICWGSCRMDKMTGCLRASSSTPSQAPGCSTNHLTRNLRQPSIYPITIYPPGCHSIIAENMYAQCDSEGNQYLLLKEIVDWRKDDTAVAKEDMYINHGSNRQLCITTKGWQLCMEWKDGTTSWERLADFKARVQPN